MYDVLDPSKGGKKGLMEPAEPIKGHQDVSRVDFEIQLDRVINDAKDLNGFFRSLSGWDLPHSLHEFFPSSVILFVVH